MSKYWVWMVTLAGINTSGFNLPVYAENTVAEIKAAYVYRFAHFIEWPDNVFQRQQTFKVCTLGNPSMAAELTVLNGRQVQGHIVRVHEVDWRESNDCQMLVLGPLQAELRNRLFTYLAKQPVLTISDGQDFTQQGGMIGLFVTPDEHVRFAANSQAAQQAGLRFNPRLQQLAAN